MEESKKLRNNVLDFAKGIAIILVIIGHCVQFGSGNEYCSNEFYLTNFLFKFIYSFHMPLFMLISGYLFLYSIKKYSTKEIIKRKLKSLLIQLFILI